jgi:hypothetical protein
LEAERLSATRLRLSSEWARKKEQLVGRIQERYGIAKDDADRQADNWARTLDDLKAGSE